MSMWNNLLLRYYKFRRPKHRDAATFLLLDGKYRCMNYLSMGAQYGSFCNMVADCKTRGADTLYLYFSNEKDGSPAPTSFYDNGLIGGSINKHIVEEMQKRLLFAVKSKMYIDGWLFADDSPGIARQPISVKTQYVGDVVKYFDPYVDRYVVALEANEYMSQADVTTIALLLRKTGKKVGLHLTSNKYDWSSHSAIDIHYHQYGFGKRPQQIQADTVKVVAALKKPVIAAEYDLSSKNLALGDAALRGGAIGTGNGRSL